MANRIPSFKRQRTTNRSTVPPAQKTTAQRGYDSLWNRTRQAYVKMHPLCEDCLEQGVITPVEQVHHIKTVIARPDLRLSFDNLRSLCRMCHGQSHRT